MAAFEEAGESTYSDVNHQVEHTCSTMFHFFWGSILEMILVVARMGWVCNLAQHRSRHVSPGAAKDWQHGSTGKMPSVLSRQLNCKVSQAMAFKIRAEAKSLQPIITFLGDILNVERVKDGFRICSTNANPCPSHAKSILTCNFESPGTLRLKLHVKDPWVLEF